MKKQKKEECLFLLLLMCVMMSSIGISETCVTVEHTAGDTDSQVSWQVQNSADASDIKCEKTASGDTPTTCCAPDAGSFTVACTDSGGDGWDKYRLYLSGVEVCGSFDSGASKSDTFALEGDRCQCAGFVSGIGYGDHCLNHESVDPPYCYVSKAVCEAAGFTVLTSTSDDVDKVLFGYSEDLCTSESPSHSPTRSPTRSPTSSPTRSPTRSPTKGPTHPTPSPTSSPTRSPTHSPTRSPTRSPTKGPTHPTVSPSSSPTRSPTRSPTKGPTHPTVAPTKGPTHPTVSPSSSPTRSPTRSPTKGPTHPTVSPTKGPTHPTVSPTKGPTHPTVSPSTSRPTSSPTRSPFAIDNSTHVHLPSDETYIQVDLVCSGCECADPDEPDKEFLNLGDLMEDCADAILSSDLCGHRMLWDITNSTVPRCHCYGPTDCGMGYDLDADENFNVYIVSREVDEEAMDEDVAAEMISTVAQIVIAFVPMIFMF